MLPSTLGSRRADLARALTFALALAILVCAQPGVARAAHCSWRFDATIGNPGLTTPAGGSSARSFVLYEGDLIAGGFFENAGGQVAPGCARWDGTQWSAMGSGFSSEVWSLNWFQGSLHAFGQFAYAWPNRVWRAARWDGSNWQPLGVDQGLQRPSDPEFGSARTAITFGDSLVVGGEFTRAGDQSVGMVAVWDGSDWHPLGAGFDTLAHATGVGGESEPGVWALAEYEGDLIAGGSFQLTAAGDTVRGIARWDGTSWQSIGAMGGGLGPTIHSILPPEVFALTVWNGDLIVGGSFETVDGMPAVRIARWDGTSWHTMGNGWNTSLASSVWSLAVTENNELIAGGWAQQFSGPLNKWQITQWNGTDWEEIGSELTWITSPSVCSLFPWGPDLVVGGGFTGNADGDTMNYISILRCNASVDVPVSATEDAFWLRVIGPNPFFASSTFAFDVPAPIERLSLEVYDLSGRCVRTLHAGPATAGEHVMRWQGTRDDGTPAPPGVYFARLRAGKDERTVRLVRMQ